MEFEIEFSRLAVEALKSIRKFDQQKIRDALVEQLSEEPSSSTRNRKRLRPNKLAEWELRVAIGYKEGNRLFILDEEFEL